jgi:hypothetical protein
MCRLLLNLNILVFPLPFEFDKCGFDRYGNAMHEAGGMRKGRKGLILVEDRGWRSEPWSWPLVEKDIVW